MSLDQVKELARRYEAEHPKNPAVVTELFAPDAQIHFVFPGIPATLSPAEFEPLVAAFVAAMPDITHQVEDVFAEGDRAVVRWSGWGTLTGQLMHIPPTGKRADVTGISISRVADGKIVELWEIFDALGFMQQIGAVPTGPA